MLCPSTRRAIQVGDWVVYDHARAVGARCCLPETDGMRSGCYGPWQVTRIDGDGRCSMIDMRWDRRWWYVGALRRVPVPPGATDQTLDGAPQ